MDAGNKCKVYLFRTIFSFFVKYYGHCLKRALEKKQKFQIKLIP